ncbi:MAG TPA: hypothetical protein PLU35_09395 [Phycisphaerales bacterium]|nr:hypothetical protein [Phycisphaerales bacterium]
MSRGVAALVIVCAATQAFVPGCAITPAGSDAGPSEMAAMRNPFAPTAIRIYPLTHLTRDPEHGDVIMCHVELKDRWGDAVKAVGELEVQLFSYPTDGSTLRQEAAWPVPEMAQPDVNSALFDPATRTYRLRLGSVPGWVRDMIARRAAVERGETPQGQRRRLLLKAVFRTVDPQGRDSTLFDEFVIEQ